jgi:hypothetical protein
MLASAWLVLAPDDVSLAAKMWQFFPHGLDDIWERLVVARTPSGAISYFQALAQVGMRHFVVQLLDPDDLETVQLLAGEVMPSISCEA